MTTPSKTSVPSGFEVRDIGLIRRIREDDDDEEQFKPLEWGLIRRLFAYTAPVKRKLVALLVLTLTRSAQLPALVWASASIISGPIAHRAIGVLPWAVAGYGALGLMTDLMFHWRQRYALEIGETVVNGLRSDIFRCTQRQPMSFFQRVKLGRIISRVTSDVEAMRVGIQDALFVSAIQCGQMVFTAIVMLRCDWELFLVVLGLAPVLWSVNRHAGRVGERHPGHARLRAPADQRRPFPRAPRRPRALQYRARPHVGDPDAAA